MWTGSEMNPKMFVASDVMPNKNNELVIAAAKTHKRFPSSSRRDFSAAMAQMRTPKTAFAMTSAAE